jgi:expansin (peptidoglycan-binding protein)
VFDAEQARRGVEVRLTGAMNTADYEGSKACGAYVVVRAAGGASVTVRITNECPGDCAVGQNWCAIQVIGHRNPLARLEVRSGSGWRRLARADCKYFLAEDGGGCGGPARITDIYGERLTVDGIAIRPDVVQPTWVRFARH